MIDAAVAHVEFYRQVLLQLICPQLMTTRLEKLEMVVVDTDEEELEVLTLAKESLLAELDVEKVEMRRKLLAFGSLIGDGGEVLEIENGYEGETDNHDDCSDNALEIKNRLLEEEIKGLRESLASVQDKKELLRGETEAKGEKEEKGEGKEGVVESFKELWLDRERLQVACSALEIRLTACLTSSFPFQPLPPQADTDLSLPSLPDLLLGHSFSLHSALANGREELGRAMADMRRNRAQYLGLPKQIRPPVSLSQVNILMQWRM